MKLPNLTMPGKPSLHEYVRNVANMWKELAEDTELMDAISEDSRNLVKEMNKELNNDRE